MNWWYIVRETCYCDPSTKELLAPISAEIVRTVPRYGDGHHEWRDTERFDGNVYTRERWRRTKAEAEDEIRFWMGR